MSLTHRGTRSTDGAAPSPSTDDWTIRPQATSGRPRLESAADGSPTPPPPPGARPEVSPDLPPAFAPEVPVAVEPTGWTPVAAVGTTIALHNAGALGWGLAGNPLPVLEAWKADTSELSAIGPQLAELYDLLHIPAPGGEGIASSILSAVVAVGGLSALEIKHLLEVRKAQARWHREQALAAGAVPPAPPSPAGSAPAPAPPPGPAAPAAAQRPRVIDGGQAPEPAAGYKFDPALVAILGDEPDRGAAAFMEASRPL